MEVTGTKKFVTTATEVHAAVLDAVLYVQTYNQTTQDKGYIRPFMGPSDIARRAIYNLTKEQ